LEQELLDGATLSINKSALVITSKIEMKTLSSAAINGGLQPSRAILNLNVDKNFNEDVNAHFKSRIGAMGVAENSVCLMTAADVTKVAVAVDSADGLEIAVVATAGTSNAANIADRGAINAATGTINIIILVNAGMTDACMANAIIAATEAKCSALASLDVRSRFSQGAATGTTSDAMVVASLQGGSRLCLYSGASTTLGQLIGRNVKKTVREAIMAHDGILPHRSLEARLTERGICVEDLVSAAMEMYVPHPSLQQEEAKAIIRQLLDEAMNDVNIASLIMAAIRLNEDGASGLIPNMPEETYNSDPVHLVADEMIGTLISMQLAGYYGLFEFYRFDRKKPGILGVLPPFLDDALGALIAGVSSKMYSEVMKRRHE